MKYLVWICSKIVDHSLFYLSIALCVLGSAQIFSRMLFDFPLSWSEEVILFVFVWWACMGAALAMRMRAHLSVDVAQMLLRSRGPILQRFVQACSLGFLGLLVWEGIKSSQDQMSMEAAITRVPMGLIYSIIPLSSFFMIVFLIDQIRQGGRGERREEGEEPGRPNGESAGEG